MLGQIAGSSDSQGSGGGDCFVDDVKFCACNSNRKNSIVCQILRILARGSAARGQKAIGKSC